MLQTIVHYGLHFIAPIAIAFYFFRNRWKSVSLILIATMLIDLDHLVATPIFDSNRCSIGFHFLHSYFAITIYVIALFFKKTRIIGIGLVLHVLADLIDCNW